MSDVDTNSSNMPREQCSAEEKGKNDDKFVQTDCTSIRKEDCGDRITIVSKAKHSEIEEGVGNGHGNPNYNKDDKSLMVLSSVENYTSFGGDETFYCNKLQKEKDYISEEISPDTIDTNNSEVVIKMKSEVLKELTIKPVVAAPGDTFEEYSKAMLRATVDDDEKQTLFCGRCKQYIADASEITTHFCVQRKTVERKNKYKQKRTVIEDSDCYGCAACGEMFKSKVDMDKHQEAHSIVKKVELVCNICNKSFINEKLLKLHSTKHTEGHNYRCHICGHTFKWRSSLNRHIRLHEGRAAKPFLCPICGKLFSSSDSKASHMRFHMGIKRYTCEICGKKFSECKHLRTHVRSHTGERPFACEFCFQSFSDKTTMRQHIRTKHKTDYYYETESAQLVETVS
ncbi:unnamed protein product [Acanthoscelides obtectus]|nr:unnamed protein product [Acanthoscelides obtectus]CAK1639634.1 Zinc finger protein 358 [Acanthoscelides obtectus]